MTVELITPPAAFVLPSDIAGSHAANDATVTAMIQAVTETIDGYGGMLGRCLGPQLLEWSTAEWPLEDDFDFPIGPLLEVESVSYVDVDGDIQQWAFTEPLYFENMPATRGRRADIKIQYWAGYGARAAVAPYDWIAAIPKAARHAVIMSVNQLKSVGSVENLFLRSEDVEGIGTTTYTVTDQAGLVIQTAVDRLLHGLKVYRV